MKPYWQEIRDARNKSGGAPTKSFKAKKREKADLEASISELITKKKKMERSISAISTVDGTETEVSDLDNSQAGNSFGGRSERSGRNASDIKTSERRISSTVRTINSSNAVQPFHGRSEMDSHADTTMAGKNCTIQRYTDQNCL